MKEICEMFGCVYAAYDGCFIKGWGCEESTSTGTKEHCPHFDVMCIRAKCSRCVRENQIGVCTKSKDVVYIGDTT